MNSILKDDDMLVCMWKMIDASDSEKLKFWEDFTNEVDVDDYPYAKTCGYALLMMYLHVIGEGFVPALHIDKIMNAMLVPEIAVDYHNLKEYVSHDTNSCITTLKRYSVHDVLCEVPYENEYDVRDETMTRIKEVFNERLRIFNEILLHLNPQAKPICIGE